MTAKIKDILKIERIKRKMTQQEVADYLHIARGSYAMYETGQNIPPTENLIMLADLYGCSLDYLAGRYSLTEIAKEQYKRGHEKGEQAAEEIIDGAKKIKPKKKRMV